MLVFDHNSLPNDYDVKASSLRYWPHTRKSEQGIGVFSFVGLFSTWHPILDTFGFCVIILGEIYGLLNLYNVGANLAFVLGFFFGDIVFAILLHLPKKSNCINKNKLKLIDPASPSFVTISGNISKNNFFIISCSAVIIFIALIKILGFSSLYGLRFDGLVLSIIISYIVVATLHIICTGNFLFFILYSIVLRTEKKKFGKGIVVNNFDDNYFLTEAQLLQRKITSKNNPHKLIEVIFKNLNNNNIPIINVNNVDIPYQPANAKENEILTNYITNNTQIFFYNFQTWGTLKDDQLIEIASSQPSSPAKIELALKGIEIQLNQGGF
jgi:hypothetical protein